MRAGGGMKVRVTINLGLLLLAVAALLKWWLP
jgi:hypothetical protein